MKLTPVLRQIPITTATWATNTWTLTLGSAHLIGVDDSVIVQIDGEQRSVTTAAGTTGTTLTFEGTNSSAKIGQYVFLSQFGTGLTETEVFTSSFSGVVSGLVHVVSYGTATATAKLQGSLNKTHWIDHGSATAITAGSMLEIPVTKPYPYLKVVFTVPPANAGGGSNTNTIKIIRTNV